MTEKLEAVVVGPADRTRERFEGPGREGASWFTLVSGEVCRSAGLSGGLCEIEPGGSLAPHRHAVAEMYFFYEGAGTVVIDGAASQIAPGMTVFIPGDAEHSVRNDAEATLRFFYVFPVDRFSDVVYRFS